MTSGVSPASAWDPDAVTLRGANIHPTPSMIGDGLAWNRLWGDLYDLDWLLGQVTLARTRFGTNAIRVIGSLSAMNTLGASTYNSRWSDFIDGCAAQGVLVYPCMCALNDRGGLTNSQLAALATSWASSIDGKSYVIGIDVVNEWRGTGPAGGLTGAQSWALCQALIAAVRNGTDKPLALSDFLNASTIADDFYWSQYAAGALDWIDLHAWIGSPDTPTTSDLDAILSAPWAAGKRIVFGEYGAVNTGGSSWRTSYFEAVRDLQAAAGVSGSFVWAIQNDGYGLVNESQVNQTDIVTPYLTFPTS